MVYYIGRTWSQKIKGLQSISCACFSITYCTCHRVIGLKGLELSNWGSDVKNLIKMDTPGLFMLQGPAA